MLKSLLYTMLVALSVNFSAHAFANSDSTPTDETVDHYWICNAYGHGPADNHWRAVTGARMTTKEEAQASALAACSDHLNFCRPSGCWYYEARLEAVEDSAP